MQPFRAWGHTSSAFAAEALGLCWLGSEVPEAFARQVQTQLELVGTCGKLAAICVVFPSARGCLGNGEGGRGKPESWSWSHRQGRVCSRLADSIFVAQSRNLRVILNSPLCLVLPPAIAPVVPKLFL